MRIIKSGVANMSVRFPMRQAWNRKWPYLRCFRFCYGIFHWEGTSNPRGIEFLGAIPAFGLCCRC